MQATDAFRLIMQAGTTRNMVKCQAELCIPIADTRAVDNKGKRDEIVRLHQAAIDHIGPLRTFHPNVFP